jgi:two-component system, NarL family, nitrate/nitrite response regulator NarL
VTDTVIPERVRLLLVDDHPLVRDSLGGLLAVEPRFEVVGGAGSVAEALPLVRETKPNVVLLDIELKKESGLILLKTLRDAYPDVRVLIVTMHNKANFVQKANAAGARGYVLKDEPASFLLQAVARVAAGERVHSSGLDWSELDWHLLTPRERQVACLLANDYNNAQIAAKLEIGKRAVEAYRANIYEKLGVSSAVGIANYVREHGIDDCNQ